MQRGSSFKDAAALGLGIGVSSLVLLNNYYKLKTQI